MKIIDRIEELNSDTDNIDYQNEAKALKAKLNKMGQILYIISIAQKGNIVKQMRISANRNQARISVFFRNPQNPCKIYRNVVQ